MTRPVFCQACAYYWHSHGYCLEPTNFSPSEVGFGLAPGLPEILNKHHDCPKFDPTGPVGRPWLARLGRRLAGLVKGNRP